MNILTLEQQKSEQVPEKINRKVICVVSGSIFEKPIFDTENYFYFTEVWKYRPFS